jgi:hypothetical protein
MDNGEVVPAASPHEASSGAPDPPAGKATALRRAAADLLCGAIFIAFGLFFGVLAVTYDVGTPFQMGPGFFPLVLGTILTLLGVLIAVSGLFNEEETPLGVVPWRAIVLLPLAFIFFGLTVRNLGVVLSLLVTTLLATYASQRTGVIEGMLIAAGLTVASVLIFIVGLQLRLPLFGPWLSFLGL